MAGRILPVALASLAGVAIGVATFGEEFKSQQRRRLQEEYERDVAAASVLSSDGPSPMASSSIPAPQPEQIPAQAETAKSSKLSSVLGFWAWSSKDKTGNTTEEKSSAKTNADVSSQRP